MRKKTLRTRIMCSILALAFLVSLFQAPIPAVEAAKTATIPVTIGNQTYQVTPGQNVTVNTPGGTTTYNVRFVDGKPVALDMTQVTSIIFGDAGSGASTSSSSSSSSSKPASTSSSSKPASTSKPATSSKPASQTSGATAQQSTQTTQTTSTTGSNSGKMTWNEFQKANAGKGMSNSEMSQAWSDYKAGNTTSTPSTSNSAAQQSTNTTQSSTPTAQTGASAPQASVAEGATSTTTNSSSSQTSTSKAWDPAKHPRDPQTGRFISHEEAIARGLMDPADATTTSSNSSQSSQTTQTTETAQTNQTSGSEAAQAPAGESGSSAQTAQASTESTTAASGEKTKTSIGDKFKSGYQTGKNLTNQGFQNVKDSLKSGFSAKNLLVTAGITVGVDLATQIMRGEQPSLQKAIKTVCCAEFVGGVAGSVLGSAAGSFFVPFLSCVPVVGGALSALAPAFGSVVGSSVGAYMAGDIKNGRFSIKEAFRRVDWVGVTGQAIGSTVGAALGSCLGPVGTVLGGMVGGYFGNWAAHKIAGLFGKGEAELPTIKMPSGSSYSGLKIGGSTDGIKLGGDDVTSVTISDPVPATAAEEEEEKDKAVVAASEDEITAAYIEYTDYYSEYSQLIQAGKTNEALEVAQKMNAAKAKYDSLRAANE